MKGTRASSLERGEHGSDRRSLGLGSRVLFGHREGPILPDREKGTRLAGICVAVADGHTLVRQGLCALLRSSGAVTVAGDAGTIGEAIEGAGGRSPGILVYDPRTVPDGGADALRRVRRQAPTTAFVALSADRRESAVRDAVRAGARAYVLKSSGLGALLTALRETADGRHWFDPAITRRDPEAYAAELRASQADPCDTLTPREREVLRHIVKGASNAQIADAMAISPNTVSVHRGNLMKKLGLHSEADVVRFAVRHGILSAPDLP